MMYSPDVPPVKQQLPGGPLVLPPVPDLPRSPDLPKIPPAPPVLPAVPHEPVHLWTHVDAMPSASLVSKLWPVGLILLGAYLLVSRSRRQSWS
ncbi:MAG: hypothetical protein M3328_15295 [Chloroflexota bacterium]|nr:hypothetical protein [Chloroflexota bacterium]